MKLIYKIVIASLIIFGLSLYITKKSIDYTYKKVECTQTDYNAGNFYEPESLEV